MDEDCYNTHMLENNENKLTVEPVLNNEPPQENGRVFKIGTIIFVLAVFCAGLFIGRTMAPAMSDSGDSISGKYDSRKFDETVDFEMFWEVWDMLQADHVAHPISEKQLFYGAVAGLVDAVGDPYTQFFPPDLAAQFADELAGSFEGIGAEIGLKDDQLVVVAPLPNTPAERAGVRAGDSILQIDKQDTAGLSVEDAVFKIRGEAGTAVVLTILHSGEKEAVEISVVRDKITIESVSYELKSATPAGAKNIGYIKISSFNEDTSAAFQKAVTELTKAKVEAIVLDLRNNPGGFLETAVDVASYWVESGPVVIERKPGAEDVNHNALGLAKLANTKTVVLVNEGSASASEIVAGALQDNKLAKIMGEQTFGKGSVQEFITLKDGSALKVTVTKWFTPLGRSIEDNGVTPDNIIPFDYQAATNGTDNVLEAALESLR